MPPDSSSASRPGWLKIWWIASRPYSLSASAMPVVFGSILATSLGGAHFRPVLFVLATVGMVLLQAAANILNDIYDYERGIDVRVLPVSGAVVRGLITLAQARRAAMALYLVGGALGVGIAYVVGWPILVMGAVGLSTGILYSATPAGLKYHALGDLAIFLDFGVLGCLGGWTVQTGQVAWLPVLWSVPISLLIVGIVHANNWRDREHDSSKSCTTVAGLLGDRGSATYFALLTFAPFVLVGLFVVLPRVVDRAVPMPWSLLLTLLLLPMAWDLQKRSRSRMDADRQLEFFTLDGATARLNLLFGLVSTGALLLVTFFHRVL